MPKRKKPTSYTIDGEKKTIEWDVSLGRVGRFSLGGDERSGNLRISWGLTRRAERATLLHEMIHAAWKAAGLNRLYSDTTEETVICSIDGWILTILRDNPKLREFLFEDD
jgi:hypothetical protein